MTTESLVSADPDVIVLFDSGLKSVGGVDGFLNVPGVKLTSAGKKSTDHIYGWRTDEWFWIAFAAGSTGIAQYNQPMNKPVLIRAALIVLLIITMVLASGIGAMEISPGQVFAILINKLGIGKQTDYTDAMMNVFLQIRLPRVLMAVLVGAGLAIAGASLQGLFRNPLADPMLIGISSGASLFAVLVIVLFSVLPQMDMEFLPKYYLLNLVTFAGACFCSVLVFRMSRVGNSTMVATLLLAGLAITALCNAFTGLLTYMANDDELRTITFWNLGSLGGATWATVLSLAPFILVPVFLLPVLSKSLNAYSLGETEAMYLGVNVKRLKTLVIVLATLAVGACVASCGIIGFVGLIVPHMLRTLNGTDHRQLLFNSALLGAVLLTIADTIGRTIIAPAELPIGIVTAMIGTPVFIALLIKQKKTIGASSRHDQHGKNCLQARQSNHFAGYIMYCKGG